MRVEINKEEIIKRLDGRTLSWLLNKMNELLDEKMKITQSGFNHLINGRSEIKLIYVVVISKILQCSIDKIYSMVD